jgi:hypothetical protein
MKSYDFLTEGIVEDAHEMHQDHEVQMARKDCYHAAEHAIALHKMLQHVSESQGLEGWVAAKITLAADYLNTVREYLEYELMNQHSEPMGMTSAPMSVEFPIAESRKIDEGKMKDLDLDLKKPPVGMTDQAFKKKYSMTKAEAKSAFSAKKEVSEGTKKRCMQCGMTGCTCAPGKCKCKPVAGWVPNKGFKKAIDEAAKDVAEGDLDTSWMNQQHQDFYDRNPNHKRDDREIKSVGGRLATRVDPSSPTTVQRNRTGFMPAPSVRPEPALSNSPKHPLVVPPIKIGSADDNDEVAEMNIGKKKPRADRYHIVAKDGKPASLASYDDRNSAEKDRDEKYQGAKVHQVGPRGKVKGKFEENAGSIATVVNPTPKNKAKVGTLFGGTYTSKKAKA